MGERLIIRIGVASPADHDVVYFDECLAGWVGGGSIGVDDLSSATGITMTGGGGADLSDPTIEKQPPAQGHMEKAS